MERWEGVRGWEEERKRGIEGWRKIRMALEGLERVDREDGGESRMGLEEG